MLKRRLFYFDSVLNVNHRYRDLINCVKCIRFICTTSEKSQISKNQTKSADKFVPESEPASARDIYDLQQFLINKEKILVLTGAGISTESGIPDYRSEGVGLYATSKNRPVQYAEFLKSAKIRQRYWARNFVGWPRFSSFQPNDSHKCLSAWEKQKRILWLVTQNVDSLHRKAGSKLVTELHGSSHRVECLSCQSVILRHEMQELIKSRNPKWHAESFEMAPDGDVALTTEQVEGFKVPECQSCGGVLKPQITFFGDNVAKHTVNLVYRHVDECDAVLVVGSSLEVYSGYRFVNRAHSQGTPIAILNIGKTRADHLADIKINAKSGDVLPQIVL